MRWDLYKYAQTTLGDALLKPGGCGVAGEMVRSCYASLYSVYPTRTEYFSLNRQPSSAAMFEHRLF